jgi:hypothetical protein
MLDKQQLINQISLLKMALEYYADEANYVNNQVNNDKGAIARNTLKTITLVDSEIKSSEEQFEEKIKELSGNNDLQNEDFDSEELLNALTKLDELNKKLNP